jgi:hypothetical protein
LSDEELRRLWAKDADGLVADFCRFAVSVGQRRGKLLDLRFAGVSHQVAQFIVRGHGSSSHRSTVIGRCSCASVSRAYSSRLKIRQSSGKVSPDCRLTA